MLLAATLAFSILKASATIIGPYTPDANTLHLWHLDESGVPSLDSATGGTNLMSLQNGASLGNPSFTGFGNGVNTVDGGQDTTVAGGKDALISPSTAASPANINFTYANATSGAFTYEAIVRVDFDPAKNLGTAANGGNNRAAPCQIFTCESGVNASRIFQFRIMPKGIALLGTTILATNGPFLTFENVRATVAGQPTIYAPIPMSGPDAIVSNSWYHVAVSYNGVPSTANNIKFYWTLLDPSRTAANQLTIASTTVTSTGPNPISSTACAPVIGNEARSRAGAFLGVIDEVRVSSIERNAVQMMFTSTALSIVTQPQSQFVAAGDTLGLNVVVGGESPRYQWQLNSTNLPSATNATFSITNIALSQGGNYRVIITNTTSSVTSDVAVVKVGTAFKELFNTGVNDSGGLMTGGDIDPHWQLTQSGDPAYPGPNAIVVGSPPGTYLANGPSSMWIAPVASGDAAGSVDYTFHTSFLLDTFDTNNVVLTGGWAMDNAGVDFLLNGVSLGLTATGFGSLTPIRITNGFVAGINTLDMIITNFPSTGANPMGLRAELRGIGLPLPPTAPLVLSGPTNVTTQSQQSAIFSVVATGSGPLSYQWFHGATLLSSQTNRALKLSNLTTADSGAYSVTISNSVGTTNASASLTVTTPPAVAWTGSTSADWDVTTANWQDSSMVAAMFSQLDDVLFDSRGSGVPVVNLTQALAPNSIVVDAATDYMFSGPGYITGNLILRKTNSANLVIDTTNSYTGITLIQSGSVQIGNADALGNLGTSVVSNNAALVLDRSDAFTFANIISGSGTVTMEGTGNASLTGNNVYGGLTVVSNGILTARNSTALGSTSSGTTVMTGAQLNIAPDISIGAEPLTLNGLGPVSDGALRKGGGGAGIIFGGPITLATDSGIQLDANATLTFTNVAGISSAGASLSVQGLNAASKGTINGPVSLGSGSLSEFSLGTWVLVSTANAWSGTTTINAGSILQVGDGGPNGSLGGSAVQNDGTLTFLSSSNLTFNTPIAGGGALNQNGNNTLTLGGLSTYSGTTTVRNGAVLRAGNNQAFGTGTLAIGGAQTDTARLELLGNLTLPNAIAIFPRAFGTLNNPADVENISGTNTLNPPGPITIGAGGNCLSFQSDSGKLIMAGGVTGAGVGRDLVLKGTGDADFQGPILAGAGNSVFVWKLDSGSWTLSGASSPGAATTISNGVLVLNGSLDNVLTNAAGTLSGTGMITGPVVINSGAILSPGPSIGTLYMSNSLTLLPGSTTFVEVNKTASLTDQVLGLTNVTYGGTLVVTNLAGTLAPGDTFKIFDSATYSGTFSSFVLPALASGQAWTIGRLSTDGTLRVATVTAPVISSTTVSGTNVILTASGGAVGTTYSVLTSTNVAAALNTWTVASTGVFDSSGNFSATNAILPGVPKKFFVVRVP